MQIETLANFNLFSLLRSGHNLAGYWFCCNSLKRCLMLNWVKHPNHHNITNKYGVDYPWFITYFDSGTLKKNIKVWKEKKKNSQFYIDKYQPSLILNLYENCLIDKCTTTNDIYVIRDPYNWIASIIKHKLTPNWNLNFNGEFIQLIKFYIDNYYYCKENNTPIVVYHKLIQEKKYRAKVANSFGFNSDSLGLDTLTINGGGSSFQGKEVSPEDLKIMERYETYIKDERYRNIFKQFSKLNDINEELGCSNYV